MTDKRLKVGIIGAGFISAYHITGLQAAGADVVAISSRTHEKARQRAQQFGILNFMADNAELLARDDVEAVVVATPDFTHKDISIAALEAGKPVLLQKPMARNSAECRAIIDVAEKTGVTLCVSFMHRYFEEVIKTRELLADKALGQVYSVRQRNATPGADWAGWFFDKEKVGGGALLQLGVHGIDLLRYLFGEIAAVRATTALMKSERKLHDSSIITAEAEDLIFATYRFESGVIATHETVYNEVAGTDRFRMEVYGENGTAWLRTERGALAIYAPDYLDRSGWFTPDLPQNPHGYRQHKHFIDMLQGDAPPDGSAKDGLASVLAAEAAYRSAATGQWEEVRWL
jgi:predicted dehydrogenase